MNLSHSKADLAIFTFSLKANAPFIETSTGVSALKSMISTPCPFIRSLYFVL